MLRSAADDETEEEERADQVVLCRYFKNAPEQGKVLGVRDVHRLPPKSPQRLPKSTGWPAGRGVGLSSGSAFPPSRLKPLAR